MCHGSPASESTQCLGSPQGPDLGSAPSRTQSSQGPRSLGTRRLRAAAPPGRGAGTPRAGEGSTGRRSGQPADCGDRCTLQAQVPSLCTGAPLALDAAAGSGAWPGTQGSWRDRGRRDWGVAGDAGIGAWPGTQGWGRGRGRRDQGVAGDAGFHAPPGTQSQSPTLRTQARAPGLRLLPGPDLCQGLADPRRSVSPTGATGTHSPSVPNLLKLKNTKGTPWWSSG